MSLLSDLRVLYHIVAKPVRGKDHAARLESFYSGQAEAYDDFRRRLLLGREAMYRSIPVPEGGVWVDLGGGTGANLEPIGAELHKGRRSTWSISATRCWPWRGSGARPAAGRTSRPLPPTPTTFRPAAGSADVVTFSYSLTMIPDWFAAIDNALAMLRPGGTIGVTDFFVAGSFRPRAAAGTPGSRGPSGPRGSVPTTSSCYPITFPICNGTSAPCAWKRSGPRCRISR